MKKKFVWIPVIVLLVIAGGIFVFAQKVKAPAVKPQCLASSGSAEPTQKDLNDIQMAAMEADMTVPAGTNADVRIATYTPSESTGSVIYGKNYGAYNYKAHKVGSAPANSNNINWKLDSATPCKP